MLFYLVQRELSHLRCSAFQRFSRSFTRQTKTSKWSLKSEGKSSEMSDVLTPNLSLRHLVKPFLFTVCFSGCSFAAATIWQYEEMRKLSHRYVTSAFTNYGLQRKRSELRNEINAWWQKQTEGQKVALTIIGCNVGVFLLWKIPALYPFMARYFTCTPAMSGSYLPMFLSTFSHYSFLHLAVNMYVLYTFSDTVVSFYGKEQFVAFYCSSGVISSFTSSVVKVASGRIVMSLGASGALMAVLSSMCVQHPYLPLQIAFLPFFTFSAGNAIKAIIAFDLVGLIAKWRFFDHAAHLGGALCGIAYLLYGRDYIWNNREFLFKWYHSIRKKE